MNTSELREWLQRVDPDAAATLARPDPVTAKALRALPRLAGAGVPAGRLAWLPRTSTQLIGRMLVSAAAFEKLQDEGIVVADETHALPDADSVELYGAAYSWLRWQMLKRVPGYRGHYPLWMWTRIRRYDLVGELTHADPGSKLLTVRVDRSRVLETPYDDWHFVLNGWLMHPPLCQECGEPSCTDWDGHYAPYMDARDKEWTAQLARHQLSIFDRWHEFPDEPLRELLRSWEHLFETPVWGSLQGCIEFLTSTDVTEVRDLGTGTSFVPRHDGRT